jgi:hypothetical protein
MDLDRNRSAPVGLIQASETSVREPPPATGIAAQEGRVRDRLRLHMISASRTQCLCPDRDASSVTHRALQRGVILHEKIYLFHIEPESMSGETDIEPRTMTCRNLNKVLLTVETFHGGHSVQTVARIEQVSTRKACIHLEKNEVSAWPSVAIMLQDESDSRPDLDIFGALSTAGFLNEDGPGCRRFSWAVLANYERP